MTIDSAAQIIWDYMQVHHTLHKCDAIFILGSRDERTAEYGAQLLLGGYGDMLIISGGIAHSNDLLSPTWGNISEAAHFGDIAKKMGVPAEKLLLEDKATNTGENITLTKKLLDEHDLHPQSFILVQKPYMERRTYATFKKQWPDATTEFVVTSPPIAFEDYFDTNNPKDEIYHIMVGDLQRIRKYPAKGFQIAQEIPDEVWQAYEFLVMQGFTKHLIQ